MSSFQVWFSLKKVWRQDKGLGNHLAVAPSVSQRKLPHGYSECPQLKRHRHYVESHLPPAISTCEAEVLSIENTLCPPPEEC